MHIPRAISLSSGVAMFMGAILLLASPGAAPAQTPRSQAAATAKERAKKLYREAEVQYSLARFKRALKLYSAAYQALQLPGFLFNIGQCHRNLQNYRKALFFYRGYLRRMRRPQNRALVLRLIKVTEQQLALKRPSVRMRQLTRPRLEDSRRQPHPVVVPPKTRSRRGIHERWWFWTALVAGVATVVGLSVGLTAMKRADSGGVPGGSLGTIDVRF